VKFAGCPIIGSDFMGEKRNSENLIFLQILSYDKVKNAPKDAH
jgi:hypothetical protein